MILLSLAGFLVQVRAPFAVTGLGAALREISTQVLEGVSLARLQRLDRGLQAHYLLNGAPARSLNDLVSEGLVDAGYVEDLSGRPYHYVPGGSSYLLSAVDDGGKNLPGFVIERPLP